MVAQPPTRLPSPLELPCSDDTPVDNEDQNLLPNLLLFALASLWAERMDWYFGVDMAVYHTTGVSSKVPVVPDAFLSLGVERRKGGANRHETGQAPADSQSDLGQSDESDAYSRGRLSYAVWHEGGVVPILALEVVSKTPGGEYDEKMEIYRRLGVLYYVLYNPLHWRRDQHQPFEVYKLVEGPEGSTYRQQIGEPYWMPEAGLGIGRGVQPVGGIEMEMLLWHDEQGQAYPVPEEEIRRLRVQLEEFQRRAEAEQQRAEAADQRAEAADQRARTADQRARAADQRAEEERQRAERLAEYLRTRGVDPDDLPDEG